MFNEPKRASALRIDYTQYDAYFRHLDINNRRKREFIDTIFKIVVHFVDQAFATEADPVDNSKKLAESRHSRGIIGRQFQKVESAQPIDKRTPESEAS